MTQLILIKNATAHASVGDLICMHPDNTIDSDSIGYQDLNVIQVPETTEEMQTMIDNSTPEIRRYKKSGKVEAMNELGTYTEVTESKYAINITSVGNSISKIKTTLFR